MRSPILSCRGGRSNVARGSSSDISSRFLVLGKPKPWWLGLLADGAVELVEWACLVVGQFFVVAGLARVPGRYVITSRNLATQAT